MLALRLLILLMGLRLLAVPPSAAAGGEVTPTPPALGTPAAPSTPAAPAATPTIDRLAAPPTAANPNQADTGAQLFWQHCQPCHGDQAQGLTDEWRAQYPTEDRNCWDSGCHGQQPYANGFILPTQVPALVGAGTLNRFATAADLYFFISHAMPFQAPGSLKPDEYWSITAFLMRGHGLADSALPITSEMLAAHIALGAPAATALAPTDLPPVAAVPAPSNPLLVAALLGGGALLLAGGAVWLLRRRHG